MQIALDVDAALAEVPVNLLPLVDDTDFKSIETAVTYNAAGLELRWNFITSAGAFTQTQVTPTTGGTYDWQHQGGGIYTIEIPASGGASINNDTEGYGWFTGVATGVLPWRGPTICFRAAQMNDDMVDSASLGLLKPATAGRTLAVSAGGAADAAVVSMGADVITSTALAANAVTEIQSGLATAAALTIVGGYIDTEVAAIKTVTDKLDTTMEIAAGSPGEYRFTQDALEMAPSGSLTVADIADAVWDEPTSGHTSAGTFGKAVDDTDDRGARTVIRGTVSTGTTTTMTPSSLSPSGAATDQFKGRIIIFDNDTSTAALRGQATDITASTNAALPQFTFSALSDAPQSGDTFSIV